MHLTPIRRGLLIASVNVFLCVVMLAGTEAVVRKLRPGLTRQSLSLSIYFQQAESWAEPSADFHHTGTMRMALDFNPPFRPDSRKILVVGDSFGWGHGVPAVQTFAAVLGTMLPANYEVHLLACSSYSPVIYRRILDMAMRRQSYAAIVIFVDQSDPADDLIYEDDLIAGTRPPVFDAARIGKRKREIERALREMSVRLYGWRGAFRRLALVNWLLPLRLQDFLPPDGLAIHAPQFQRNQFIHDFNLARTTPGSRKMEALLGAHVREMINRAGATPLFLAANPWQFQVDSRPGGAPFMPPPFPKPNVLEMFLREVTAADKSVHIVPLTTAFAAAAEPQRLFLPSANEIHWSAAGHEVAARALFAEVSEHVLRDQVPVTSRQPVK